MRKHLVLLALIFAVFTLPFTSVSASQSKTAQGNAIPLAKAHAHNDYEHARPLLDALDHGFTSVEADVWLEDGELLVAHDKADVRSDRTLKSLYLEPLKEIVKNNKGSVYPGYHHEFILWIDIKSEGDATYQEIHEQLSQYSHMLTKFVPAGVKPGAVTVYISGNRPRVMMENQIVRYAAYDGRMSDLGATDSNEFIPVISDNWTKHFTWTGIGKMPDNEQEKLNSIVETAHANGQKVRFWATPDIPAPAREAIWLKLLSSGVDFINTDDLGGLEKFLKEHDPEVSEPNISWETKKKPE